MIKNTDSDLYYVIMNNYQSFMDFHFKLFIIMNKFNENFSMFSLLQIHFNNYVIYIRNY